MQVVGTMGLVICWKTYSINVIFCALDECQIVYNLILTICRDALVQLTELM